MANLVQPHNLKTRSRILGTLVGGDIVVNHRVPFVAALYSFEFGEHHDSIALPRTGVLKVVRGVLNTIKEARIYSWIIDRRKQLKKHLLLSLLHLLGISFGCLRKDRRGTDLLLCQASLSSLISHTFVLIAQELQETGVVYYSRRWYDLIQRLSLL